MKKPALAVAASLLLAGTAQAAIVTVEYSVPVASIAEEYLNPYSYEIVANTYAPGFQTFVGDPITGRLTYDDAAPLQSIPGGYAAPIISHTLTFFLSDTTVVLDGSLATYRNAQADGLVLASAGYIQDNPDPYPYFVVEFSFVAPAGTHAPEALPTAADWQDYAANGVNPFRMSIHGNGFNVYLQGGDMSVAVSAVPEPASAAMTLAGLAVVGAIARRRKPARA